MGFSVWSEPTLRPVNPLGGETINRRAVCGRTACTVRRGEGPKPIGPSYPYHDVVSVNSIRRWSGAGSVPELRSPGGEIHGNGKKGPARYVE